MPPMLSGSENMQSLPGNELGKEAKRAEIEVLKMSLMKNLEGQGVQSVIPSGMRIDGMVRSQVGVKIDGQVAGSVEIEGNALLVISPGAEIMGSIRAKRAIVMGTVHGGAIVESLVVHGAGRVFGEARYLAVKVVGGNAADRMKLLRRA